MSITNVLGSCVLEKMETNEMSSTRKEIRRLVNKKADLVMKFCQLYQECPSSLAEVVQLALKKLSMSQQIHYYDRCLAKLGLVNH